MTVEQAREVASMIHDLFGEEARVREEYYARGSFGRAQPAIVTEADAFQVGYAAAKAGVSESDIPTSQDAMGKYSCVYY